jgi:hypothetical protein
MHCDIFHIVNLTADNKDYVVTIPILASPSEAMFHNLPEIIIRGASTVEVPRAKGVSKNIL